MIYKVRLLPEADDDLRKLHRYISEKSSPAVARNYIERIQAYLRGFEQFPQRGMLRVDLRSGIRIVGFERRVSIAFSVVDDEVVIVAIRYAGRQRTHTE